MRAALPRRETGPFAPVNMRPLEDARSEEEYLAEIDQYIEDAKRAPGAWWGIMAEAWLEAERSILGVSIVSRFEENYENTVLELTFELPRAGVHLRAGEVSEVVGLPERPHTWGRSALDSIAARDVVAVNRKPEAKIERVNEARTLVRYPEVRVRPHAHHALQPLLLALSPTLAGGAISVHWRVTASNAKSDQSGSIELRVPGEPAAEPQKAGPQEEVA